MHLEAAGPPYTEADLAVMGTAAEEALRVDGRRVAALLSVVLDHVAPDDPRRVRLRARQAQALVVSGDLDAAHGALTALERDGLDTDLDVGLALLEAQGARDEPDPDLVARLAEQVAQVTDAARRLDGLGRIAFHAVRADSAAFRDLIAGLPADGPDLPVDARVHLLLARAQQHWADSDTNAALEASQRAYRIARDHHASLPTTMRAGLVLGRTGADPPEGRRDSVAALQELTRWAEDAQHPTLTVLAHASLANASWIEGDWDQAETAYGACATAAEEAELPAAKPTRSAGWR